MFKPNRKTPRNLKKTEFGYTKDDTGSLVYDSPIEMGKYLYTSQGRASFRYQGTCGLCSCANILRLSGVNYDEKDMIDYATNTLSGEGEFEKLCVYNPINPWASGATSAEDRKKILEHFGIRSDVFPVVLENGIASEKTVNEIAKYVEDGRGVIISVHSSLLYYGRKIRNDYHAVTVTSVVKDECGEIQGFYICDSNRGTKLYDTLEIRQALTGVDMNVTDSCIR